MKKLDKLFLQLFLRYLVLILPVIVFLLLTQYLLKYFDDFVGKGVGILFYVKLIFYLSANMVPMALNLSVMMSALMTYGTLGEHSELTAIKASGISSFRLLYVVFLFVVMLSVTSFFLNAYLIPRINLKAFLLLHDIRKKKPAFNILEKEFYSAIPDYSIRIDQKLPEDKLKGIMIYDHSKEKTAEQQRLILADSGYMYNDEKEELLHVNLFNGNYYLETQQRNKNKAWKKLARSHFSRLRATLSLSSFQMEKSAEERLSHMRRGKQIDQLFRERDSIQLLIDTLLQRATREIPALHLLQGRYQGPKISLPPMPFDSLETPVKSSPTQTMNKEATAARSPQNQHTSPRSNSSVTEDSLLRLHKLTSSALHPTHLRNISENNSVAAQETLQKALFSDLQVAALLPLKPLSSHQVKKAFLLLWNNPFSADAIRKAKEQAQYISRDVSYRVELLQKTQKKLYKHEVEAYMRYTLSYSCLVMFLIGATVGGIIKKGGLGVPVLIATSFFILFHVTSVLTEKYAREGLMSTWMAAWAASALLSVFAAVLLVFLAKDVRFWDRKDLSLYFSNFLSIFKKK